MEWVQQQHPDQYDAALALANGQAGVQSPDAEVDRLQGATEDQIERRMRAFETLLKPRLDSSPWSRMYVSPITPEAHDTTFITECALDFLDRQSQDTPFICHVSYVDPHDPYNPPEPYASLFDPVDMPEASEPEWKVLGPPCLADFQDTYLGFKQIADDPGAIRVLRALYHGQLKLMDDQIGRLLDKLKESGLWENTIVLFTTDHGDHLGDHGMISKGLPQYDAGIRCPLIVGGGRMSRAGVCSRLVSTLDLFPTFCDWAGIAEPVRPPLEGISFAEGCRDPGCSGPDREICVTVEGVHTTITSRGRRVTWYDGYAQGQDIRCEL
jgi:arylsulfatase A-like enzyme